MTLWMGRIRHPTLAARDRDRALAAAKELRTELKRLAASHDGYHLGVGPCVCAAHLSARERLAATAWVEDR